MQGKIIKGISGFYYVYTPEGGIYECRAKGAFRRQRVKPLVGDDVEIAVIDEDGKIGNVERILPRKIELIRPAVANVDMALVVIAAGRPDPKFNLLDRFLCMKEFQNVAVTICFNKCDLVSEKEKDQLAEIYRPAGYPVIFTAAKFGENIESLRELLAGKTTVVAGPSGVGKSSLINGLQDEFYMETGAISAKIGRGKNTTRHSEIVPVARDTFIVDTPGFSSLTVFGMEKENLSQCYPELVKYEPYCRFRGCSHISEPDCGVKEALKAGKIHKERYRNYVLIYEEMKNIRKY